MENIFETNGKEFVELDNRKNRAVNNISAESLFNKFSVLLPEWLIKGKTILDLGSCLGAAGHWALSNGAIHYTGVEIQQSYTTTSALLLEKHWKSDQFTIVQSEIESFLEAEINSGRQYDIVIAGGILYAFIDLFSLIRKITNVCKESVLIDTVWLREFGNKEHGLKGAIMFSDNMAINYADDQKSFRGLGTKISPIGLNVVMANNGFYNKENTLMPVRMSKGGDSYHDITNISGAVGPSRYMARYFRGNAKADTLKEKIVRNDISALTGYSDLGKVEPQKVAKWEFDQSVAKRFQQEASNHIPDYNRVIQMCVDIANMTMKKDDRIVDVGSALGNTINQFVNAGYTEVYGIEPSESMLDNTLHRDRIIKSDWFPKQAFQLVMINWTLHFVLDKAKYLADVFGNMPTGGTLIISDKTIQTPVTKELYYQFKRDNGVDQEYIDLKEKQLKGVMHCMPASWYVRQLESIGFVNVEVINSKLGFVTFMCKKP